MTTTPRVWKNIMYGFVIKYEYGNPVKETKISLQTAQSQTRRVALILTKVGEDSTIHRLETQQIDVNINCIYLVQ